MYEIEHSEIEYDPDMIVQNAESDCTRIMEDVQDYIDRLRMLCDDAEIRFKHHIEAARKWAQVADELHEVLGHPVPERNFTI